MSFNNKGGIVNGYLHIVLKPDAFLRDIVNEILYKLNEAGIKIYLANIIRPNKSLLKIMYDGGFQWEYDDYIHNERLYDFGPTLSLVCNYDAQQDYRLLKGSSLPIHPYMKSIRQYFQVKDRTLNLVHIADTLQQSQKEIEKIYQINSVNSLLAMNISANKINNCVCDFLLSQPRELYYEVVMAKVIRRIKYRIWCILLLKGVMDKEHFYTDDLDTSAYKEFLSINLQKAFSLGIKLDSLIRKGDSCKSKRALEYFFILLEREMIYVSDIEKYIMIGQGLYNDVNT